MTERETPSISVSIPDPELRAFVREQAATFFGGKIASYIGSLIEMDRREDVTRNLMLARLMAPVEEAIAS